MGEWQLRPLADCMAAIIDYRGKTPRKTLRGVPLITAKVVKGGRLLTPDEFIAPEDYDAWMQRGLPKPGDVLITTEAPLGEVAQLGETRVALAQRLIALRGKDKVLDNTFFKFLMQSAVVQDQLRARASGSTVLGIKQSELRKILLPLPAFEEQRAIASILGALDDKIDLNRRMNETLEAMARAIFKDWFVDFGPTRAKMEGREPYLAPDLWALFPDRLDDEGKPEGWERLRLEQIAQYCTGAVSPASEPDRLFEHYSLPAFDNGQEPSLDLGATIKSNKTLVPDGAVLLSKLNPEIPRVWMINRPNGNTQVSSTEFLPFLPKAPAGRSALFCLFSDSAFRQTLQGMVTGTSKSHQRVSPSALLSLAVISGTAPVFKVFEDKAAPILERTLSNRIESRTLAQTRDLLLPRLMSGEIRVGDVGESLAEAVG